MQEQDLEQVNAQLLELDDPLREVDAADMLSQPEVFSLTSLIDSSAAAQAAERLYASNLGGVRFFSELNRAMPRARAMQTAQRLESVAMAEVVEGGSEVDPY